MIQSPTSRKRSSGSFSRHKRAQRLILNPPKLPKLTIRPPKPPQQHSTTVKMVLRPPRSPSPEVERCSIYEWTEISLLGNGADASYDFSDICKVQAVMKAFNGLSSATRRVEAAEQKLNHNESADIAMSDSDAASTSHIDDCSRAELEMNIILQEALYCRHCEKTMYLKPEAMESDIRHGIYRPSEDPPFRLNQPQDDIAPDEKPEDVWEPGYLQFATSAQREQYLQLAEQYISRNRKKKVFSGMETKVDQGYESQFAFYCVDYHIHQHYIHRRSILNYCRTNDEMEDIRDWKHRLALWTAQHGRQALDAEEKWRNSEAEIDFAATSTSSTTQQVQMTPPMEFPETSNEFPTTSTLSSPPASPASSIFSSAVTPSSPSTAAASSPPKASYFPNQGPPLVDPWPKQQLALSNQICLHRQLVNPRERAARVRAARSRFREIVHKRAIQHRDGLIIANYEAAFARQRWLRGRGGPLAMSRDGKLGELLTMYNR